MIDLLESADERGVASRRAIERSMAMERKGRGGRVVVEREERKSSEMGEAQEREETSQ